MPRQHPLYGGPLYTFALPVNDPQVEHAAFAAGVDVRFDDARHLARRKRVQVEGAVERDVHGAQSYDAGVRFDWQEVRALRLARHHLDRRAPRGGEVRVASRICGLHAQLLSSAALSLWARVEGTTLTGLRRALWQDRTLVKSWAMRGTLHLLPARDLPVYLGALSTYRHYLTQGWVKYFGLTREEIELVIEAVGNVLRGCALTRDQLADAVVGRTGSKKLGAVLRQSWGVLLKPAAYRGQLCFAESDGPRVRFTHPGPVRQLEPSARSPSWPAATSAPTGPPPATTSRSGGRA